MPVDTAPVLSPVAATEAFKQAEQSLVDADHLKQTTAARLVEADEAAAVASKAAVDALKAYNSAIDAAIAAFTAARR